MELSERLKMLLAAMVERYLARGAPVAIIPLHDRSQEQ